MTITKIQTIFFLSIFIVVMAGVFSPVLTAEAFTTGVGGDGCCGDDGGIGGVDDVDQGNGGEDDGAGHFDEPQQEAFFPQPVCTLTANPDEIFRGDKAILSWSWDNGVSASITHVGGVGRNDSTTVEPSETVTYVMTVVGHGANAVCTKTIRVKERPQPKPVQCTLNVSPHEVDKGGSVTVSWSTQNATSVSVLPKFGSEPVNNTRTTTVDENTTFVLTASGVEGDTAVCRDSVAVRQAPPPPPPPAQPQTPTCTLSANPNSIQEGGSSTLSWSSTNATSASLSQGIGSVGVNGSRSVSPSSSRTYTLTVSGPGGSATCNAPITVTPKVQEVPTCSIHANPSTVSFGGSTTVNWNSTNATSATLSSVGSVNVNGSHTFNNITATRTFTLNVSGPGGNRTCETTVHVSQEPVPTCSINVTPSSIQHGGNATLYWSSQNATSASITHLGSVSLNGSRSVSPANTTTYTMTVEDNRGRTNTCSATLNVEKIFIPPPVSNLYCTINANPQYIQSGAGTMLTWSSFGTVVSSTLSDFGYVPASGSRFVNPGYSRSYTLTVRDVHGNVQTCSTNVTVALRPVVPTYVTVASVPYTGFGDGFSGTMLWLGLAMLAIASFFTLAWYRKEFAASFRSVLR